MPPGGLRPKVGEPIWSVTRVTRSAISAESVRPPLQLARVRTSAAVAVDAGPVEGTADEGTQAFANGPYLPGRVAGSTISFLVGGIGVEILQLTGRDQENLRPGEVPDLET